MIILEKNIFIIFFAMFSGWYLEKKTRDILPVFFISFRQIFVFPLSMERRLDRCECYYENYLFNVFINISG